MTRLEDRRTLACTIAQARAEGARLSSACALAGIDARTLQRWQSGGDPAAPGWVHGIAGRMLYTLFPRMR